MKYFNSFDLFMESFKGRHREWFEGPVVRKAMEGANAGNVVSVGPLSEPLKNIEEVDWKKRAAGEEDWDAQEPIEPEAGNE